jgi:hypothetical protein
MLNHTQECSLPWSTEGGALVWRHGGGEDSMAGQMRTGGIMVQGVFEAGKTFFEVVGACGDFTKKFPMTISHHEKGCIPSVDTS